MSKEREERKKSISEQIQWDKDHRRVPTQCMFNITTPRVANRDICENDENMKIITNIFDKYGIEYNVVDTVAGSYNLNRDWLETSDIPCYVEYGGVYPVNWDIEDVVTLEEMDYEGKLIIRVLWHEDDEYIPNN